MVSQPKVATLDDIERVAKSRTEKSVWDYWASGSNDLVTLKENSEAFGRFRIRTRTMVDVSHIDTSPRNQLFDQKYKFPLGISPSAHHLMACPSEGEVATAKACQASNVPMALSSYSNRSAKEVHAAAPSSAVFFQLYVFKNRATSAELVKRAEKAGFKAILLTSDTPYVGQRHEDYYNDFKIPTDLKLGNFENLGIKIPNPVEEATKKVVEEVNTNVIDPSLTWATTIPWLKSITKMQIWAKGILSAEDAEAAIAAGVDGIMVSNHGGRQMDSTIPAIEALPEVVDAVAGRVPVHLDGGARRGSDIFKALALGADFVWTARPALWGLKYDGQKGVEKVHDILHNEFKIVMALAGVTRVENINRSALRRYGPALVKI